METTAKTVNNAPLVSILMVTYNRADFIGAAIASVMAQTYKNWELIIIDDGSTDGTKSVTETALEPRIRYVSHDRNKGIQASRNEALSLAHGNYIAVLDSDDLWTDPQKLEAQVAYLNEHPDCVVVGTSITRIDRMGNQIGTAKYASNDASIRRDLLLRNQFAHSSVLMRKTALAKTEGYRFELAEDFDLFLQLGKLGKFANLSKAMTSYRVHGESASTRKLAMAKSIHAIIERHAQAYPFATFARLKNYLRIMKAYFPL
jgi:glycosyltransferase involved in cell wall biosynthesis